MLLIMNHFPYLVGILNSITTVVSLILFFLLISLTMNDTLILLYVTSRQMLHFVIVWMNLNKKNNVIKLLRVHSMNWKSSLTCFVDCESTVIWESDMGANICDMLNIASRVIWEFTFKYSCSWLHYKVLHTIDITHSLTSYNTDQAVHKNPWRLCKIYKKIPTHDIT